MVAGILTAFAGMLFFKTSTGLAWILVGAGTAMVVAAYMLDAWREKKKKDGAKRRIEELTRSPWKAGQSLKLRGKGARVFLFSLALFALGIGFIHGGFLLMINGDHLWKALMLVLLGPLLILVAAPGLADLLSGFGKPGLVLDSEGFITPVYGRISWQEVTGISHRRRSDSKGLMEWYELIFRVRDTQQVIRRAGRLSSLRYMLGILEGGRGAVIAPISDYHEMPETAVAVARFLWTQATGRNDYWSPRLSDAANEAYKTLSDTKFDDLNQLPGSLENMTYEERMAKIAEIGKRVDRIKDASHIIDGDLKK